MLRRLFLSVLLLLISAVALQAQDAPEPLLAAPYAYVDQAGNLIYAQSGGAVLVTEAVPGVYESIFDLAFSPNGQYLAFLHYRSKDETGADINRADLRVFNLDGASPVYTVVQNVSSFPKFAWTADSRLLYVVDNQANAAATTPDAYVVDFYTLSPAEVQPQLIGTAPFGVGCGGGSDVPTYALLNQEAGFGGNDLFLAQVADGRIIYSSDCSGVGLSVFTPSSGQASVLDASLGRVQLSPSGTTLAGVVFNLQDYLAPRSIRLIDVATGSPRDLANKRSADQLGWGGNDDVLYYSSVTEGGDLVTLEQMQTIVTAQGYDPSAAAANGVYKSSFAYLTSLQIATGAEQDLYSAEATGIQRIQYNSGLVFYSQIPTLKEWAQAILDGKFDPLDFNQNPLAYLPVAVLYQDTVTAELNLLGLGINKITLP